MVQGGLAITPAQMDDLRRRGIPISTSQIPDELFFDGDDNPSFDMPLDHQRGIDIAEIWQEAMTSKKKTDDWRKYHQANKNVEPTKID